jgi:hypothetical protein
LLSQPFWVQGLRLSSYQVVGSLKLDHFARNQVFSEGTRLER